jgi:hypothetical protein
MPAVRPKGYDKEKLIPYNVEDVKYEYMLDNGIINNGAKTEKSAAT